MNVIEHHLAAAAGLLATGRFDESVEKCREVLGLEPGNATAAHILGLALVDSGNLPDGERWLRESIDRDPNRAESHLNLANLLKKQAKLADAEGAYRNALALDPADRAVRHALADLLIDSGKFEEARRECRSLVAADSSDGHSWLLLGLSLMGLDRPKRAEAAFRNAIALNPRDAMARNNLAALLNRLDRPQEALAELDSAAALGASGYEIAFNRGRSLLELNRIEESEREFARAVAYNPSNPEAQVHLTRLRYMRGDPKFARSMAEASAANRDSIELQSQFATMMWRSGNLPAAETLLRDLMIRKGPRPQLQATLAGVLHEAGRSKEAETLAMEAAAELPDDSTAIETLVTIMLALGHAEEALPFIRSFRQKFPFDQGWVAYEASAARAMGDTRYQELYNYDRFVRVYDLEAPPGWTSLLQLNAALAEVLNHRHGFSHHPLDQTLRNGTQTASSIMKDPDPAMRSILQAFAAPIDQYRRDIGSDPAHLFTSRNIGAASITSAWSVRLRKLGFHVNHFHPEGWISSAYYVDVPPETQDQRLKSGWIKFGEPRYEVPGQAAELYVQPRPGRLVLFPSYMWHGTNAIHGDQPRLTIAFDVTPQPS